MCIVTVLLSLGTSWIHAKVLVGAFVVLFPLPFIFVPNGSLLSKLLPKHVQGMISINCIIIPLSIHGLTCPNFVLTCNNFVLLFWGLLLQVIVYGHCHHRIWPRSATVYRFNSCYPRPPVGRRLFAPVLPPLRSTSWHSNRTHG